MYGVNTGFGKLANQRISKAQLDTLQLNLIRSHSVGVGEPIDAKIERLTKELLAAFDESARLEQVVRTQLGRVS